MTAKCVLCGEPMPAGEEMFQYHGYSEGCSKPPAATAVDGEAAGRRLYEACHVAGIVNDLRHWDERSGQDGDWSWRSPSLDEPAKEKWRKVAVSLGLIA